MELRIGLIAFLKGKKRKGEATKKPVGVKTLSWIPGDNLHSLVELHAAPPR